MSVSLVPARRPSTRRRLVAIVGTALLLAGLLPVAAAAPALAGHTPDPASVTVAGSLQSELGCAGDWDPTCATTHLTFDADDDAWQGPFNVPAGDWEYKAPLNDKWDENYGLHAQAGGANIPLSSAPAERQVLLRPREPLDHRQRHLGHRGGARAASRASSAAPATGTRLPRSWLQDLDGDGIVHVRDDGLPAGSYEAKVAINEAWDENYGQGGVPNGANIPFTVPADGAKVTFSYVAATHVLTIRRRPRRRQQRRVGRPPPRLARATSTGRRAAPSRPAPGHAPVPDLPRRRHRRPRSASSASASTASRSSR